MKYNNYVSIRRRHDDRIVLLVCLLLFLIQHRPAAANNNNKCTLCLDGTAPAASNMIGSTNCSLVDQYSGYINSDEPTCKETQLVGYRFCECESYPQDVFCPMCDNGFFNIPRLRKPIPLTADITCEQYLFAKREEVDDNAAAAAGETTTARITCDTVQRAAYYCGCPDATAPTCSFCPVQDDKPAYPRRLVPPNFEYKCSDYVNAAYLLTSDDTSCDSLGSNLPVNVRKYCGCQAPPDNDDQTPKKQVTCSLCSASSSSSSSLLEVPSSSSAILDPKKIVDERYSMTCQDFSDMAESVHDGSYCRTLQMFAGPSCCEGHTAMPTAAIEIPTGPPTAVNETKEDDDAPTVTDPSKDGFDNETATDTSAAAAAAATAAGLQYSIVFFFTLLVTVMTQMMIWMD